jgi:putative colanic acid biosynthesis UDP-glucose lipid carrier transferase
MNPFAIRNSASTSTVIVQALDFLAVLGGGWVAYQLRFSSPGLRVDLESGDLSLLIGVAAFSTLFLTKVDRGASGSLASMIGRVTMGWFGAWVGMIVFLVLTKSSESYSRIWMVSWLFSSMVILWLGRVLAFTILSKMRSAGYLMKNVILYGDSKMLETVQKRVDSASWSGYDIIGTVIPGDDVDMERLDAKLKPDEIWISLNMSSQAQLDDVMHSLRNSVANIRLLSDLMMYRILNHGMSITVGIPMVDLSVSPMFGGRKYAKAFLDYTVATIALLLLSPVMIAIAIAVKLTSEGPVLFKQKRLGWNDDEILVYKFRSMAVHQEQGGVVKQAQRNDPRVTPLGRFLRKSSLDELPQFINVLQGRMSVVGPRPHAIQHNKEYMNLIPKYALRHKVKPGITGWAQICGYRGETDTLDKMEGRIKHDIYYLEHWSIWLDIKIIAMTPLATILNKNVY